MKMFPSRWSGRTILFPSVGQLLFLVLVLAGCASTAPDMEQEPVGRSPAVHVDLEEIPTGEGAWRPHRLSSCPSELPVLTEVEGYLGICSEYFRDGSGSDGMLEMEFGLAEGVRHPLMLLTLGQLYLMAGQGDPALLPGEGPAADVGNWERNRVRLLQRSEDLLLEAAADRSDDAAVDYLLADVSRARGARAEADQLVAAGLGKCTPERSFAILWQYQGLNNHPPRYLGGSPVEYPQSAVDKGISGDVDLDVLLSPAGEVRQLVVVESPAAVLSQAAAASVREGRFEAARVGKYPIWSWIRVTTAFNLEH